MNKNDEQGERRHNNAMPTESMGKDRNLQLYSLHKPAHSKSDKHRFEVEYEKSTVTSAHSNLI